MRKPLVFAIRGAIGFGLTGVVLLFGLSSLVQIRVPEHLVYGERHPGEAPCIGEWRESPASPNRRKSIAKPPNDPSKIVAAEFREDGSFRLTLTDGTCVAQGTYRKADASTVKLEPAVPWVTAKVVPDPDLPYYVALYLAGKDGTSVKLSWFRRSAPAREMFPYFRPIAAVGIVILAGMLGAAIAFFRMGHWKRAVVGFGFSCVLLMTIVYLTTGAPVHGLAKTGMNALGYGLAFGLFGTIGGRCLNRRMALSGALVFGLPGMAWGAFMPNIQGLVGLIVLVTINPLVFGGALFGFAFGKHEKGACPAPSQPE